MSEAGIVDAFFFVGPKPKDMVRQYTGVTGTPAMPQFFFFFSRFFFFNSEFFIKKEKEKKEEQNGVVLSISNGSTNWVVTKPWIDKNWKLEDWIDKTES